MFEAYHVEKSGQNANESAHSLIHLFSKFSEEERLRDELFVVTTSLQNDYETEHKFYIELFDKIPEFHQRKILLFCATICTDRHKKCKLQLLLMKKFPDLIQEYGSPLVESLLELGKTAGGGTPCNKFRQLLVTEVLPIILECSNLGFTHKQLSKLLTLSMEFYITTAIQPKSTKYSSDSILKSPTKVKSEMSAASGGDSETEFVSDIINPWERLRKLFFTVAKKNGWNLEAIPHNTMSYQESFASLTNTLKGSGSEDMSVLKSVFYSTAILYFRSMYTYYHLINPAIFGKSSTPGASCNILIEDLESKKRSRKHKHRKRTIEGGKEILVDGESSDDRNVPAPLIVVDDSLEQKDEVIRAFTTAVGCWQLIANRETFYKDFTWLLHRWKSEQWPWIRLFHIDMHLYRGEHSQALKLIQAEKARLSKSDKIQLSLQQASCHFTCGQHTVAAESILSILPLFEQLQGTGTIPRVTPVRPSIRPKNPRFLNIIPCKMEYLLPYCMQLIYMAFKKRVFPYADAGDTALGHMITLMQYDWPKEQAIFAEILKRLTKVGSFSYPVFFSYIINIDILEEFAYLVTADAGSIKLDLFPPCITIQRQQRTITRGITRGGKEDFRATIEKQLSRCDEDIQQLLYKFLITERDSLLQCLNSHTVVL